MNASTAPRPPSDKELALIRKAMAADASGDYKMRDRLALRLFRYHGFRHVQVTAERAVSTWYDQRSHNWVTQVLNYDRGQVGDADFGGWIGSAAANHLTAIYGLLVSKP